MKNEYVTKHDYGYGKGLDYLPNDMVNKLNLRNIDDLTDYLKDAIEATLTNAKVINGVVRNMPFEPATKLIIKKI